MTWILTTAAALMALIVNARNLGWWSWFGFVDLSFADHAAYRVVVTPRADTLFSVGDTTLLAATVTDHQGAVLSGAQLHWRSDDSAIAVVDSSGTVVAKGPGRVRVTVTVRDLTAGAMISVLQHPARVILAGDSTLRIRQGDTVQLAAIALDARGHRIGALAPRWHSGDTLVVSVDTLGTAIGRAPGHAKLWASEGEAGAEVSIEVQLTATGLAVLSGDRQRGPASHRLPEPIVFRAVARGGQPVPGATVTFSTADGEGQVDLDVDSADHDGRIRAIWTLSSHPGPQRLLARIPTVDTAFTVVAEADPVRANTHIELRGAAPEGQAGSRLPQPVTLRFTDSLGTAFVDVPVTWTLLDGGSVAASTRTDSMGDATAHWTLGPRAGSQRLLAQVGNPRTIPPFTVTATAAPGPPAAIAVESGQGQRAPVARQLPKPVVVVVRDSLGNPIAGGTVTARTAQGTLSDTSLVTSHSGHATLRWTLGPTAGDQRVELRVAGLDAVARIVAHGAAGSPSRITVTSAASPKSAGNGTEEVVAVVTDTQGNPVPGVSVRFAVTGGSLSSARGRSDTAGRIISTWTPTVAAAEERVTVSVPGTKLTATTALRHQAVVTRRKN
ncbi:MAG TPA: Ig-like domain-containing protein [Gemmatimonadales bacterium]|nr:Ig-like domain-containing protein [Gemmatimonadales bacterium]